MRDFDVYGFLPVSIAEFCQKNNRVFTQLEKAAIVYNSEKTVPHKHKAYKAIIESYPDIPIPPFERVPSFPGISSLHETLRAIIKYEENVISDFSEPDESIVYLPQLMADTGIPYQYTPINPSALFPTIDKAISAFDDLAGLFKESVGKVSVEKLDLSRTDSVFKMDNCLFYSFDGEVLSVPYLFDGGYDDDDESRYYFAYFQNKYNEVELEIPPIKRLTDSAVKDAVFAILIEICKKDFETDIDAFVQRYDNDPEVLNFDLGRITELELIMPESLDDLKYFPNLERLIICLPAYNKNSNALNAGILACPAVDDLCLTDIGGKLKEVIIKRDLG